MKTSAPIVIPRSVEPIIHLIVWLFLFGFPHMVQLRTNTDINEGYILRAIGPTMATALVFYVNYLFIVPRYLLNRKIKKYVSLNLVVVTLAFLFLHLWFYMIDFMFPFEISFPPINSAIKTPPTPPFVDKEFFPKPNFLLLNLFQIRDFVLYCSVAGLAAIICMSQRWHSAELSRKQAEVKQFEAELQSLRCQINPHFLLNTLNNIYALISFNTEKAQDAIQQLSKLLRHLLYENETTFTRLDQEIDFLRSYVELMKIRLSDNVEVVFKADIVQAENIQIAPLIFVSLIENAFKHGISSTKPSFVHIHINVNEENNELIYLIRNSNYPKNTTDISGNGIGLDQVQRRLDLIYPDQYSWEKGVTENGTCYSSKITLHIPLKS